MGENNKYVYSEHMTNMMKVFENSYRFMEEAMYESPIKLMETEWSTQMDGNILKAVKNVGIDVDKNELLRALEYDRGQYNKGYSDGVHDVCRRIVERLEECAGNHDRISHNAKDLDETIKEMQFSGCYHHAIEIVKEELN